MISRKSARTGLSGVVAALGLAACSPQPSDVTRLERMTPPLGQVLQQDGKTVHVWVQGSGPDVILLHGASGNLRDFTFDLAPKLAQDFRVIAFDRPGLGYSEALGPDGDSPQDQARHLAKVADQLGVRQAVIVGHSYGGAVAMAWALERPDQTAALVSLAGAVNPWPGGLGLWYDIVGSKLGGATIVPLIAAFVPKSRAERAVAQIFTPDPVPQGYVDYIGVDLTLRSSVLRANGQQVGGLRPHVVAMSQRYPDLKVPVEILHGAADDTVPLSIHSQPLSQAIPGARLTVLDGVGHMPHHADPAATLRVIRRAAQRSGLRPGG